MMTKILKSVVIIISTLFLCPVIAAKSLQIGDLVLRAGTTMDSLLIQKIGRVEYSHIGIITQIQPEVIVTHSTTDDDPDHPNQVLSTPLSIFLSPEFSQKQMIVRLDFLNNEEKQILVNHIHNQVGQPYSLKSKEHHSTYCTTLISQPLLQLRPNLHLQWHNINFGPFKGDYLFPDAFLDINAISIID